MKQVLQNLKSGETELIDLPCPAAAAAQLLIQSRASLVSVGTERMLLEFGKANLWTKARQQPDKVRMVLDKIKTDGLIPTISAVRSKLDQPIALGYCNVGTVVEVGRGVTQFKVGDRVASNGKHAEVVAVPVNLCAKVPDAVSDEDAAFTVIGAIALQGIRLAAPTLGEAFVIIGLGLIGLVAVQLLKAHGCRVLGLDFDESKLELARRFGAETVRLGQGVDVLPSALAFSRGRGIDGVLITASTKSSEPVHQAAQMCRKRGRIVLVGVTGLELSRADFYEKELSFQVSCSYGPGRYDPAYEEKGQDYPVGFVRWTEQRNFEAVLDLLSAGRVSFASLISHRFPFARADKAYQLIGGDQPVLGIVLQYDTDQHEQRASIYDRTVHLRSAVKPLRLKQPVVSFIGAGNYGTQVLIPAFSKGGARLKAVASSGGVSASHAGRKYGFEQITTDTGSVLTDPSTHAVVIVTRHNTHARMVCEALRSRKHVFVEKPLAINEEQLSQIESAYLDNAGATPKPLLMVGFNRRFAPHIVKVKELLAALAEPKSFIMTVNAGSIPAEHWTQDLEVGGGRIIGEACHFIDLLRHLADATITGVRAMMLRAEDRAGLDKVSFMLSFADGSVGTVHYLANGHKSFPKERLDIFCAGRVLELDNFRKLTGFGWPNFRTMNLWRQDKGQTQCAAAFVRAIQNGTSSPIAFPELVEVTRASFEVLAAVQGGTA